jgi:hypothetical protein
LKIVSEVDVVDSGIVRVAKVCTCVGIINAYVVPKNSEDEEILYSESKYKQSKSHAGNCRALNISRNHGEPYIKLQVPTMSKTMAIATTASGKGN